MAYPQKVERDQTDALGDTGHQLPPPGRCGRRPCLTMHSTPSIPFKQIKKALRDVERHG